MVEIKIGGPGGVRGVKGPRRAGQTTATDGPSFAEMLDQAGAVEAPAAPLPNLPYTAVAPNHYDEPGTSKQQANTLLETLTTLADDALAGTLTDRSATRALADLQAALQQNPVDRDSLTPPQQQAIDELATRAAVEVAKRGG